MHARLLSSVRGGVFLLITGKIKYKMGIKCKFMQNNLAGMMLNGI